MAKEQLNIARVPGVDGFFYMVRWSTTPMDLPLDAAPPASPRLLLGDPSWTLLEVLDELADDGRLMAVGEGRHLLAWQTLDVLAPDEWDRLGLPEVTRPDIKLRARHHLTRDDYRIDATVRVSDYPGDLLTWGTRVGRYVTVGTGAGFLLDGTSTHLLDILADGPGPTWEDRIAFTAEVKALADAAGAQLDTTLSRDTVTLVDEVGADVVTADDGSLEITPRFHHGSFSDQDLRSLTDIQPYYRQSDGRQAKHFVVSRRARQSYERVRESAPRIPVNEVLSFLENPEAFIPEDWGIDLARFSERVKGLKPRAYRAQPFVTAQDTHRGWFDVSAGVRLDPVAADDGGEGTERGNSIPLDEYQRLVEQARENGSSILYRNGQWVEVTDDNTLDALKKLDGNLVASSNGPAMGQISGQIEASRLPFVLEIFTNIEHIEFNQPIIEALDHLRAHVETLPPDTFTGDLALYQLEAFRRLLEARNIGLGLLLADEMGLGKTVQVLAALSHWKATGILRPSLIVVPLTLIENWVREARKFDSTLTVHVHQGAGRIKSPEYLAQFDLVLTPYETVLRDQLDLGQVDWQVVILDEAQQIKNASASRTSAVKALKAAHRLALTGTPVENNILDLWSICDFVQPGFLGSSREFARQYRPPAATIMSEDDWMAHGEKLAILLRPIMMRRTKDEVALSLPAKIIAERRVSLGPEQYRRYQEVASLVHAKAMNPLKAINRLRALSAHPLALERNPNWSTAAPESVPKLAATLDILREILQQGEKVLIFCESRPVQEMLRFWILQRFDKMAPILNGASLNRQGMVDRFQAAPGFGVMILSPKAGGVGLNIVGANHVIHYMRWWNPAVENQATDRAHRRGQTLPVTVYYPIATDPRGILARGTVEEILDEVLREKSRLASQSLLPMRDEEIEAEVLERTFALR